MKMTNPLLKKKLPFPHHHLVHLVMAAVLIPHAAGICGIGLAMIHGETTPLAAPLSWVLTLQDAVKTNHVIADITYVDSVNFTNIITNSYRYQPHQ